MDIPIDQIQIPGRVRKDLGDLDGLMTSLKTSGQLNPITLTRDNVLIAGHRRLECARRLGWRTIEARVVDGLNDRERLEMEIAENLYRRDFSAEEVLDGFLRLEKLRRPSPTRRIRQRLKAMWRWLCFWRRAPVSGAVSDTSPSPPFPAAHA